MGIDFRLYAIQILGELPATSFWIYDLFTILIVLGIIFILCIPISCIIRRFSR